MQFEYLDNIEQTWGRGQEFSERFTAKLTEKNRADKISLKKQATFASQRHPFHILGPSPLPFLTSRFLFAILVPLVLRRHDWTTAVPLSDVRFGGVLGLFITVRCWFCEILYESRQVYHTRAVQAGLRAGRLLFIASEVRFFFAFFWAFFHFSLVPSTAIGAVWPPVGTQPVNPWGLPLVNTLLLLTSGVTITLSHAYLVNCPNPSKITRPIFRETGGARASFAWFLLLTVILGVIFLFCQAYEYKYGITFSWRDNLYGSIFFVTTGFHGFHVTIGTLFLLFCWLRNLLSHPFTIFANRKFARDHHFGFEAAAWYWHFVDVVWIFLFVTIYWWGGSQC